MKIRRLVAPIALTLALLPQLAFGAPPPTPDASPAQAPSAAASETPTGVETATQQASATPLATTEPTEAATEVPSTPTEQEATADLQLGRAPVPQGKTGESVAISVPLVNWGETAASSVLATLVPSAAPDSFPLEISNTSLVAWLSSPLEPIAGRGIETAQQSVDFGSLRLRSGLATGYYPLPIVVQYRVGETRLRTEMTLFVHVEGVPQPEPDAPTPVTPPPAVTDGGNVGTSPDSGSGSTGSTGSGSTGSGSTGSGTTGGTDTGSGSSGTSVAPRIMLTSFATDPAEVLAGQSFRLTFTLQNKSASAAVSALTATIVSGEGTPFLPVGGSSSMYFDRIGAGASAAGTIEFRALPTLEERPYQLTVQLNYVSNGQSAEAQEVIAVVVKQLARADTSNITVVPDALVVGQDASVSFQVRNKGKSTLYNTTVKVKPGQSVSGTEVFVGNVEAGSSGTVDLMLHADSTSSGQVALEISYEDAAGTVTTMDRNFALEVTESSSQSEPSYEPMPEQGGSVGGMLIPLLLILAVAGGITALIVRRRRQARDQADHEAGMELLDSTPLVDPDEPATN